MNDVNKQSRSNKFEKRRKNTKKISILMIVASILILILLAIWIFGGKDKDNTTSNSDTFEKENMEIEDDHNLTDQEESDAEDNELTENQSSEDLENDAMNEENNDAENENTDSEEEMEIETEQLDPSDDNVIEAYTGNWQPIGTVQEGPHTTNYDGGSQDRIEIKQAVMSATGLSEDMIEHWVGNGGDQKVVSTVANSANTEYYRVYLSWIDNEGWQATKVERLKELQY